MTGLTSRQRAKINAALSMIHAEGYDAQAVNSWAAEYERKGYDKRRAFEQAINEFVTGQPDLAPAIGKVTRLIQASDDATVVKYNLALSEYIATGDDKALAALSPMIARDSLALAVRNGELPDGAVSAESLEAALGFAPADGFVTAASAPASAQPNETTSNAQVPQVALEDHRMVQTQSQVSAYSAGGRISNPERWAATPNTGSPGRARLLLETHVIAPDMSL